MLASAEPVEASIPLTAPLPVRAVPVDVGVATPGQGLIRRGDRISARFSLSGFHIQTTHQDFNFAFTGNGVPILDVDQQPVVLEDRSIDLLRARAHLAYQQIAHSEFGAHLDVEYRPRFSGDRFESAVLNELYLSYGLADFRGQEGPSWGLAAGRLAVREAGYAQADGLAFRIRLFDGLHLGVFGGFTGNPFGYNWRLKNTELFSMDWITGGAFGALRFGRLNVSLAGVLTYANVDADPTDSGNPNAGRSGLDRAYVYVDASYLALRDLNLFLNGWVDLVQGQLAQNVELVTSYTPRRDLSFTLGVGRFSTVAYDLSSNYSFVVNPDGNRGEGAVQGTEAVIIGVDGNPVLPFDGALYIAVYNSARLRAGYDFVRGFGVFARVQTWLRDISLTEEEAENLGAQVRVSTLRVLPGMGVRFSDRDYFDANVFFSAVIDAQSNADGYVRGRFGREFFGLYTSIDARHFFGAVPGTDAGASLAYTFPRDWFPGLLTIRGSFRYFREDLDLSRPSLEDPDDEVLISVQESYQAFGGVEWRL